MHISNGRVDSRCFIDDVFLFVTLFIHNVMRRGIENEKDHALLFRWDVYQPFSEKDEGGGQLTRSGR